MTNKVFISENLYKEVLDKMPIPCVDVVIKNKKGEILLIKRLNEPEKGIWWVPGGRINKNESIKKAALRKAKEEVGLDCEFIKILGSGETIFNISAFKGITSHTINIYVLLKPLNIKSIKLDNLHSGFKFVSSLDLNAHPYMKEVFLKAQEE